LENCKPVLTYFRPKDYKPILVYLDRHENIKLIPTCRDEPEVGKASQASNSKVVSTR
ncbi:4722_t:CDS:1, partial [Dentiscutata erythropus]